MELLCAAHVRKIVYPLVAPSTAVWLLASSPKRPHVDSTQPTRPIVNGAAPVPSAPRALFLTAGLGLLLFVVYGSLVPFDFHGRPLDAAWRTFQQAPWLVLGIDSRADWVANLLLYIPLGF